MTPASSPSIPTLPSSQHRRSPPSLGHSLPGGRYASADADETTGGGPERAFCLPLAGRVLASGGTRTPPCSGRIRCHALSRGLRPRPARWLTLPTWRPVWSSARSRTRGSLLGFSRGLWDDASRTLSPEIMKSAGGLYGSAAKTADFMNMRKDPSILTGIPTCDKVVSNVSPRSIIICQHAPQPSTYKLWRRI